MPKISWNEWISPELHERIWAFFRVKIAQEKKLLAEKFTNWFLGETSLPYSSVLFIIIANIMFIPKDHAIFSMYIWAIRSYIRLKINCMAQILWQIGTPMRNALFFQPFFFFFFFESQISSSCHAWVGHNFCPVLNIKLDCWLHKIQN